jgi:hypothetical protein
MTNFAELLSAAAAEDDDQPAVKLDVSQWWIHHRAQSQSAA